MCVVHAYAEFSEEDLNIHFLLLFAKFIVFYLQIYYLKHTWVMSLSLGHSRRLSHTSFTHT